MPKKKITPKKAMKKTMKETYASPSAKRKHEGKETPAKKRSEKKMGRS